MSLTSRFEVAAEQPNYRLAFMAALSFARAMRPLSLVVV
jgi:hypothetical protein